MKRSMIAVCLLLLLPGRVVACFEDHNAGAGWFESQSPRYSDYGRGAQAMQFNWLLERALVVGGVGLLIVFGAIGCAKLRTGRREEIFPFEGSEPVRLAVPFDEPVWEASCDRSEQEFDEENWLEVEMAEENARVLAV